MTQVINIHHNKPYDVYCGRAGKGESGEFGNPTHRFETFADYFHKRLKDDPAFREKIHQLKGKKLGCFCAPKECHVMIIVEYLEGITVKQQMKEYIESIGKYVAENIFESI